MKIIPSRTQRYYGTPLTDQVIRTVSHEEQKRVREAQALRAIETSHPTLLQIAEREWEIKCWQIRHRRWERSKLLSIATFGLGLISGLGMMIFAVGSGRSAWILAGIVTGACLMGLSFFLDKAIKQPASDSPRPLELAKFSETANQLLRKHQTESEPFRAVCACPGCGSVEAHLLHTDTGGVPEWAAVIRTCGVCYREWGQA